MKTNVLLLMLFASGVGFAQSEFSFSKSGIRVEEFPPIWPGCEGDIEALKDCFDESLSAHISEHFIVPYELDTTEKERTLKVYMVVSRRGDVRIRKIKGGSDAIQEIARKTFESMPKMIPGKMGTKNESSRFLIPINF